MEETPQQDQPQKPPTQPDPASSFHIASGGQDPPDKLPTPDQFDWGKAVRGPKTPDPIADIGAGRLKPEDVDKALASPEIQAPPKDKATYDTKLSPEEEKNFQTWKQKYAPKDTGEDYDLRGAFKAGLSPDPKTGHWPDTYKKPNHPTFSDQSMYAKDAPEKAGHWEGDKYIPPKGGALPDVKVDMSKAVRAPTGRPPAPGPAVTAQPITAGPSKAAPPATPQERQAQAAQQTIDAMQRPSWTDPNKIAQDPSWYGRSLRYAGGDFIGSGKALGGFMVGGAKLLHDVASALDPIEGYHRPLGDPQLQVGRDILDVGKGVFDVSKGAWTLLQDLAVAATMPGQAGAIATKYSDPEKFGKDITNVAFTADGGLEVAKALKPSPETLKALNNARVGVVNSLMEQHGVERAHLHKNGVEVAKEIVRAEDAGREHVREHTTNLTSKIGNKPVEADTTAQRIRDQSTKTILTEPPGKMAAKKGPKSQIPAAVPRPLDDVIAYINSVKPGTWTWETVKQFRTEVGRAMSRASGADLKVLADIYYNDLTPKLRNMANKYGLGDSWKAYNDLEMKVVKSFPAIEKARAILEGNGEGAAMANALKDPAVLRELLESLKDFKIDSKMIGKYMEKSLPILRESGEFNKSMFRYVYRFGWPALGSIPAMYLGKQAGGWMGGMALGASTGFAINYLMHAVRAMGLEPHLLDQILDERRWHKVPIPEGEGWEEPPAPPPVPGGPPTPGPTEPPGPRGVPPTPGPASPAGPTGPPPAPVPGGAQPTPEAAAAAKAAEPPPAKPSAKSNKQILDSHANSLYGKDYDELTGAEKKEVNRVTRKTRLVRLPPEPPGPPKPETAKEGYAGPERRATKRTATQEIWARNQIEYAKEQIAKSTDENEKNILRRRIEELEKDPTLSGGGEQMGRDIRAARAEKPSGLTEQQVTESIKADPEKAKKFEAADSKAKDRMLVEEKRRMEAAGAEPKVTKVPEGETGREPGKRPGTTRQTPEVRKRKKAEAVAKQRAEKGATAAGGGGLELRGEKGEAAMKAEADKAAQQEAARMQQASQQPQNVKDMGIPEKEEWLKENRPDLEKVYNNIRKTGRLKGKALTGEDLLQVLDYLVANGMDEASAKRQLKAEEPGAKGGEAPPKEGP